MTSEQPPPSEILASLEGATADVRRLVEQQQAGAVPAAHQVPPTPQPVPPPGPTPAAPAASPPPPAAAAPPPLPSHTSHQAPAPPWPSRPRRSTEQWIGANMLAVVGALALGGAFAYQRLQSRMPPEAPVADPDDGGSGTRP